MSSGDFGVGESQTGQGRRVLVTGAAGFIGYPAMMRLAEKGWTAFGFDLIQPFGPTDGVHFTRGDINDAHLLYRLVRDNGIDTIIHGGGVSGPMLARENPRLICQINVVGTIDLLEIARSSDIRRFVFMSSAAAYGDTPSAPVPEASPFRSRDVYAASKAAGDVLTTAYRLQHGLDAVSLRISSPYGPGRRTFCQIRTMIENALEGRPTQLPAGRDVRPSLMYIDDCVAAVIAAAEAESFSQPSYNVAGNDAQPWERIAEIVGKVVPQARIAFAADGVTPGYRREPLDISAARADFGWEPGWTLERGIAQYAGWLRERNVRNG